MVSALTIFSTAGQHMWQLATINVVTCCCVVVTMGAGR